MGIDTRLCMMLDMDDDCVAGTVDGLMHDGWMEDWWLARSTVMMVIDG